MAGREPEVSFVTECLTLADQNGLRPVLKEQVADLAAAIAGPA